MLDRRPVIPWLTSSSHLMVTFKHIVALILKSVGTPLHKGVAHAPLFGHLCLGHRSDPHLTILEHWQADEASGGAPGPAERDSIEHGTLRPGPGVRKSLATLLRQQLSASPAKLPRTALQHHFYLLEPLELFYSVDNPGSKDVIETLEAEIWGLELTTVSQDAEDADDQDQGESTMQRLMERSVARQLVKSRTARQLDNHRGAAARAGVRATRISSTTDNSQRELRPLDLSRQVSRHVFVLVLNQSTFLGDEGKRLEQAVARALITPQLELLLMHCTDHENDGCAFETIIEQTPHHLLRSGIYKSIAHVWLADASYKAITVSKIAKCWKALPNERVDVYRRRHSRFPSSSTGPGSAPTSAPSRLLPAFKAAEADAADKRMASDGTLSSQRQWILNIEQRAIETDAEPVHGLAGDNDDGGRAIFAHATVSKARA